MRDCTEQTGPHVRTRPPNDSDRHHRSLDEQRLERPHSLPIQSFNGSGLDDAIPKDRLRPRRPGTPDPEPTLQGLRASRLQGRWDRPAPRRSGAACGRVGTASSSGREAVAGAARTASCTSYASSTSHSGRSGQRATPGRMTAAWLKWACRGRSQQGSEVSEERVPRSAAGRHRLLPPALRARVSARDNPDPDPHGRGPRHGNDPGSPTRLQALGWSADARPARFRACHRAGRLARCGRVGG
jgi:hypothetical protein